MNPTIVIIGASSGIGRSLAYRWAAAGNHRLLLAGRDVEDLGRTAADLRIRYGADARALELDVLDFPRHKPFWRECMDLAGNNLEGVIVAHGMLPETAEVEADWELLRRTIDTNYTSAVSILNLAASELRKKRGGFLCVITSVAGDRGRQGNPVYGSTKAALTTFLDGLRVRLSKRGIAVVNVKPGFVDTPMIWGMPGVFLVAPPDRVADDVYRAVRRRSDVVYTPWFWRPIMFAVRSIPGPIFNRMKV